MRYAAGMSDKSDSPPAAPSPRERLAELVALKKASQGQAHPGGRPSERAAAARSASKSKPATRK
jgi:hypothetical protein